MRLQGQHYESSESKECEGHNDEDFFQIMKNETKKTGLKDSFILTYTRFVYNTLTKIVDLCKIIKKKKGLSHVNIKKVKQKSIIAIYASVKKVMHITAVKQQNVDIVISLLFTSNLFSQDRYAIHDYAILA